MHGKRDQDWLTEEEDYLRIIATTSIKLSKCYHSIYFKRKTTQTKLKIPAIIIGSFSGVASFGTTTFPKDTQKWVAIIVGVVNICIATLNTLETFFKIGEDMNSAKATSEQLRKIAEDIEKELCLPEENRATSGIQFLRDTYTRYQQVVSNAPMLLEYISYADKSIPPELSNKFASVVRQLRNSLSISRGPRVSKVSKITTPTDNSYYSPDPENEVIDDKLKLGTTQISTVETYLQSSNPAKPNENISISKGLIKGKESRFAIGEDIETGISKALDAYKKLDVN
jgi:hypothetical protein